MTIDEAIKHYEKVLEENEAATKWQGITYTLKQRCAEQASNYKQLAEWLTELKERRAADVKRGYWKDIMMSEATGWDLSLTGGRDAVCETVCSVCGGGCAFDGDGEALLSQYCPDCGARMDGDTNG